MRDNFFYTDYFGYKKDKSIDDRFFDIVGNNIFIGELSGLYKSDSQRVDWHGSDTQELFLNNYSKYVDIPDFKLNKEDLRAKESLLYYQENPIKYVFNKEGFRDDPLDAKPKEVDVYLGCSFTSGVGSHHEHTWVYKLKQHLDFPSINAGIGGIGVMSQYRILVLLSKRFNIRNVFHLTDINQSRFEWYYENISNSKKSKYKYLNGFPNENITEYHIENIFNKRNVITKHHILHYALKGFCENKGIKLFSSYIHEIKAFKNDRALRNRITPNYLFDESIDYLARDLGHHSNKLQHFIFLHFLNSLGVKVYKKS